jgi:hypothetical protein
MDIFSLLSLGLINGEITTQDILRDKSYKRFIISANKMIKKYGRTVNYHTVTNTSATLKPWTTDSSTDDTTQVKILFTTIEQQNKESLMLDNGIRAKSKVLAYLAYQGQTPSLLDYIDDSGKIYNITNVQVIKPGSLPILFIMEMIC